MRPLPDNTKDTLAGPDGDYRPIGEGPATPPRPSETTSSLDALGEGLSDSVSGLLGTAVRFTPAGFEEINYGEYLKSVDAPSCCWVLGSSFGTVWVELSPQIAERLMDLLLGGTGSPPRSGRNLSVIGRSILQRFVDAIADTITRFLNAELTQGEWQHPRTQPHEQVVVAAFALAPGDADGTIRLCIPRKLLDLASPHDQRQAEDPEKPRAADRPAALQGDKP